MNHMKRRSFMKQIGMTVAALALATDKTLGDEGQSKARGEGSGNASRVPKYTFADTLKAQEAQLRTNPLMRQFRKMREQGAGDRYRPVYHFTSPNGTMSDPNGFCFWRQYSGNLF